MWASRKTWDHVLIVSGCLPLSQSQSWILLPRQNTAQTQVDRLPGEAIQDHFSRGARDCLIKSSSNSTLASFLYNMMAISHHLDTPTLALHGSYRHTKCKGFLHALQEPNKCKSITASLKVSRTQGLLPLLYSLQYFSPWLHTVSCSLIVVSGPFLFPPKHSLVTEFIFNSWNTSPCHSYTHKFSSPELDSGDIRCPQKLPAYQWRPSYTQLPFLRYKSYASRAST